MNTFGNNSASESSIAGNAHGDFARAPTGPSMSARPGDAPVSTNIADNAYGDFVRLPPGSSMNGRPGYNPVNTNISSNAHGDFGRVPPGPNSSNVPANTTHSWAHQQHPATGGPAYRPQAPIQPVCPKRFQIFVNNFIDSKNHAFEVSANDTVEQLKGQIEAKLGVAKAQQRLVFAGKNLEDGMKLSHYDIQAHSTVLLTGRLRGG